MRFDTMLPIGRLDRVAEFAGRAEDAGLAGLWTAEAAHDAFLPLVGGEDLVVGIAEQTRVIALGFIILGQHRLDVLLHVLLAVIDHVLGLLAPIVFLEHLAQIDEANAPLRRGRSAQQRNQKHAWNYFA